jgi:hypothetical protein
MWRSERNMEVAIHVIFARNKISSGMRPQKVYTLQHGVVW